MATNYRRGADAERRIAELLGGQRVGNTGKATADVIAGELSIEVKHRQLPAWLLNAMAQAENAADGRMALVALHASGERYDRSLVVLRLADLQRILCYTE